MSSNITDKIINPTDFAIDELILINHAGVRVDISNLYIGIEMYENLFSSVMSGKILIQDKFNMRRNIPLIGKEKLFISFRTPSTQNIKKEFRVYDFLPIRIPGQEMEILSLNFSTIQNELDYSTRISKSYKNLSWTQMVQRIFEDYLKTENRETLIVVQDTHPKTSMIVPSWTPLQAINWITTKTEYYGNYDYLFYESFDSFHFVPLAHLKRKPVMKKYKYTPEIMEDPSHKPVEKSLSTIRTFINISESDKKSDIEMEGVFSSRMVVHDPLFKSIDYRTHSYIEDHEDVNIVKLEPNPIAPLTYVQGVNATSKYIKKTKSSFAFDNIQEQYSPFNQQKRISHILRNNATMLKFDVPGDSRMKLGDVVEIVIPSPEFGAAKNEEDVVDGYLSGKYIISAIGHHIQRNGGYEMAIEVMKDSMRESIPDTVNVEGGS
jgi:hypothetical protein